MTLKAVWCRRTDELVDGPNASHTNQAVLDRWEQRLEGIFQGQPYDMLDATLTDTIYKFPIDIKVARSFAITKYVFKLVFFFMSYDTMLNV